MVGIQIPTVLVTKQKTLEYTFFGSHMQLCKLPHNTLVLVLKYLKKKCIPDVDVSCIIHIYFLKNLELFLSFYL